MWPAGVEYHIVLVALLIDAVTGDPPWLYRRIPHPVACLGKLVELAERSLNVGGPARRFWGGLSTLAFVLAVATALAYAVLCLTGRFAYGWVVEATIASTLLAFRGLYDHVRAVALGLEQGLDRGREAVRHVVGRDPRALDEGGVARAAIESLAENFSDGVVVPLFWYALLGLPGLAAYKAINTLDSMIGHRSDRYRDFGRAAARLDDAVNLLPARLAGLLLVAGAGLMPGADARRAFRTMLDDAPKHRSPNAGWPEAAVAGALDLSLAGPRRYPDEVIDDAWMGSGRAALGAIDIHASLRLYLIAGALVGTALAIVTVAAGSGWR